MPTACDYCLVHGLQYVNLNILGRKHSSSGGNGVIDGRKVAVVLPAYNAAKTLEQTFAEIPTDIVDDVILVDDASTDLTVRVAERLGIHTVIHARNAGYGANQKTCYSAALSRGADIVVMLHPDYQYSPRLLTAMAGMIASGHYDAVMASRILGGGALTGGMPRYKYIANRFLTAVQNLLMGAKLSEYHTGYRAWSRDVLTRLPLAACSDDFVFDNEMVAQAMWAGFKVGEISCPTKYFPEASSINFRRSCIYGLGVLRTALVYRLCRWKLWASPLYAKDAAPLSFPSSSVPSMTIAEPIGRARAA
nr:glycosyltransferase family 2 protein [Sphingomonas caseinilyticus]